MCTLARERAGEHCMAAREIDIESPALGIKPNDLQQARAAAKRGVARAAGDRFLAQTPLDARGQVALLNKMFAPRKDRGEASSPGQTCNKQGEPSERPIAQLPEAFQGEMPRELADPNIQRAIENALAAATQTFIDCFTEVIGTSKSLRKSVNVRRPARQVHDKSGRLRGTDVKITAAIDEARDLGVNSIDDLKQLIAVDQDLTEETPPASLIKAVNEVDPVRFGILLAQHRKLLKVTKVLSFATDLFSIPTDALVQASRVAAIGSTSGYAHLCPAQAFREAARRSENARTLISVVDNAAAALVILGFDGSFPASGLEAVVLAALVANQLPSSYRAYFVWSSSGGADAFYRAHRKWAELVVSETEWSARLSGYPARGRPSVKELEATATQLALVGLRKLRAKLAGDGAVVRQSLAHIGFDPQSDRIRDDLEAFLAHLRAVHRFCANVTYQQMFGREWAGLDTPFDQVAAAIRKIRNIKEHFREVEHGWRVFDRLTMLEADQIDALGALAPSMDVFRTLSSELKTRLAECTVETLLAELKDEQELADAILDADPERSSSPVGVPLSQVYDTVAHENLRRELSETLERDSLAPTVMKFSESDETAEAALKAVTWANIIRRNEMPSALRSQLLSDDAVQVRERVRDVSVRARSVLQEFDSHVTKFEEQFGIEGLSSMALSELLSRADRVIGQRARRRSQTESEISVLANTPAIAKAS